MFFKKLSEMHAIVSWCDILENKKSMQWTGSPTERS